MRPWRNRALAALLVMALAITSAWVGWPRPATAEDASATAPGLAAQLRHVGRDGATGLATWVGEGFIAQREHDIERYGKDEREPVPPPPVNGPTVSELNLPELGVAAPVERLGVDKYGRLDVPENAVTAGWHPAYSSLPGEDGATFIAAHYEYGGSPGIFHGLSSLEPGERFSLQLDDGETYDYIVSSALDYELEDVDMGALLHGREGMESVTLMTCSGRFVDGTYDYRTVVLAERAPG